MKNLSLSILLLLPLISLAQSVGIGTQTPHSSAMLDVSSNTKGLLIPRLTEAQKEGIANPATGLLIWQTTGTSGFYYNGGTAEQPKWYMLSVAADTDWKLAGNNNVDSATHFLGSINKAPVYFKVRNTWAGQLDSGKATFFGYKAGWKAPHRYNTAFGTEALSAPSEEQGNSAFGFMAARNNRSGYWLTAIGHFALYSNITGEKNTAIGSQTLFNNESGDDNTAVGTNALFANDTSSQNTAVGAFAMQFNKASQNTALGYRALTKNVSGYQNTAIGRAALAENSTGDNNTALGTDALFRNTTGNNNTANGSMALYMNTTGFDNTANGMDALRNNTTGSDNTANGRDALFSNTTGSDNTANGKSALKNNTTGSNNTANGRNALVSNTTGFYNTANGEAALFFNTTGNSNTANGLSALAHNTTGSANTANGMAALRINTTGNNNTSNGWYALASNTTGNNNTAVGHSADVTSGALTNATAIGYNAKVNASNKIRLGNAAVTVIEGQVPFTHPSDGRFKTNVSESDVKGLDFIIKLRPVVYNFDTRKFNAFARSGMPEAQQAAFAEDDYSPSSGIRQSGFIAQEVEKAAREAGYNFNGIHIPENDKDHYSLAYSQFVVPLVKGMQEQQQIINAQQQQIDDLKKMVEQLLNLSFENKASQIALPDKAKN